MIRKAFQTCQMIDLDESEHESLARKILKLASEISFDQTSGHINGEIHRLIRESSGVVDPYNNIKSYYTDLALRAYPELKHTVQESPDPFDTAVRVALAGSAIDYTFNGKTDIVTLFNGIESVLSRPLFYNHICMLSRGVQQAKRILYLSDNAGETVFDRILIEELPRGTVTYVVKGAPVLNDATLTDAQFAGLTDLVEVIDSGSDSPGTILESCSPRFRKRFDEADLIIAKGQSNFKTLNESDREIYFVFRVKCRVVSRALECSENELVVKNACLNRNGKVVCNRCSRQAAS